MPPEEIRRHSHPCIHYQPEKCYACHRGPAMRRRGCYKPRKGRHYVKEEKRLPLEHWEGWQIKEGANNEG